AESQWQGLLLTELCIALVLLGAMTLVPLPPSERSQAFEGMDLVTISLLVPAGLLLSAVLGLGRILWWTDTPWLGLALASAL
ncbi:MFS transporter, partial [Acinetobacter baumannii]